MSASIQWILERRDVDGRFHAVASKSWALLSHHHFLPGKSLGEALEHPALRLSFMDRESCRAIEASNPGLPDDISEGAAAEEENWGDNGTNWAWVSGDELLRWAKRRDPARSELAATVLEVLESGVADEVLAPHVYDQGKMVGFADAEGLESAHARLARQKASRALIDWRTDPMSWRLVTFLSS